MCQASFPIRHYRESVVCKLRTGDRENSLEKFVESLATLQGRRGNRVSALTIHGRTKVGRYTKLADWE